MTRQPPSDKRLGRNEQCPCRSGLKYKKCHGANNPNKQPRAISPDLLIRRQHAIQHQRELQQGLGSPIITETFQGERVVAVGDRIFHSARWKTFHDFLFYYVIEVVGLKWFQAEELKDESARHPIFQLDRRVVAWLKENKIGDGEVKSAPMTGATAAYLRFAYHLYLLNHNGGLPEKLLARLRDKGQFDGAQHELYVAATFIKAGFKIEFEDESDSTRSHCEFTVTHKETNCRFSVEAKARAVQSNLMRGLLSKALAKDADHKRIVWIAINAPASDHAEGHAVLQGALQELRERESTLKLDGKEVPPAYVIVSNQPYSYALDSTNFTASALVEGFKISDFKFDQMFHSIREMRLSRDKHLEINDLMKSMRLHDNVPITFDGQVGALAFSQGPPRLMIGETYEVPDNEGLMRKAALKSACVDIQNKSAMGFYTTEGGQNIIVSNPLTDAEMEAYARHPETFFGILEPGAGQNIKDPLELFDWMYRSYRTTPREKLLEFMRSHSDATELQQKSQAELVIIYCERCVESMLLGQ